MTAASDSVQPRRPDVAGVVLAAGAGLRLRPLTLERPKALCPVGNRPLVDWALERLESLVSPVAVNVHHRRIEVEVHLAKYHPAVHVSGEEPQALGTAGAIGNLREWIDHRPVVVTNADAWLPVAASDMMRFIAGWDGERMRLLCVRDRSRADFDGLRYAGVALLPWRAVEKLRAEPCGLYERLWRSAHEAGELDLAVVDVPFIDCGTPADYLAANLAVAAARGEDSIVSPDAVVLGEVHRCVVWPGARVHRHEMLTDAVRTPRRTVLVR